MIIAHSNESRLYISFQCLSLYGEHFIFSDHTRRTTAEKFDPSLSPNAMPPVIRVLEVPSRVKCASACFLDEHCLTFATRPSGSRILCGLTDYREAGIVGVPPGIWGQRDTNWYLTDV